MELHAAATSLGPPDAAATPRWPPTTNSHYRPGISFEYDTPAFRRLPGATPGAPVYHVSLHAIREAR